MWLVEVIRFRHLKQIVDESLFLCVRKILFKNGELTLYVKQIVISITNLHVYPQHVFVGLYVASWCFCFHLCVKKLALLNYS